jgi:hypothetical protein
MRLRITCGNHQRCLVRAARHVYWRQHIHACLVCAQRTLCVGVEELSNSHSTHASIRTRAAARRRRALYKLCNMPSCTPIDRIVDVVRCVYCSSVAVAAPSCSIYSTLHNGVWCVRTRKHTSLLHAHKVGCTAVEQFLNCLICQMLMATVHVHLYTDERCVHTGVHTLTRTTVATAVANT